MVKDSIILTGGEGGFGNLGDEALLESVKSFYRPYTDKYNIVILITNPPINPSDGFVYVSDNPKDFKGLGLDIGNIKLVHYYGGGYLNKYWYQDKIWLYHYLLDAGLSSNKFVFTGQGLGPFEKREVAEINKIIDNSLFFASRDKMYKKSTIKFSFDETIKLFNPRKFNMGRRKYINVHFRPGEKYAGVKADEIISGLKIITDLADEKGLKVRIFTMLYQEKERLLEILSNPGNVEIWDRFQNFNELTHFLSRGRLNISQSYHGALSSIYGGTPTICLYNNEYYQAKYMGLNDVIESSLLKVVPLTELTVENVSEMMKRDTLVNRLINCQRLTNLKCINKKVYKRIRNILDEE